MPAERNRDERQPVRVSRRALGALALGGVAAATLVPEAGARVPGRGRPGERRTIGEGKRAGTFVWEEGDQTAAVAADPEGAIAIPAPEDPGGRSGAWLRADRGVLRPEWFGAAGDGRANDTEAFAALGAFVSKRGGGDIALSRATYIVGRQRLSGRRGAGYAFTPGPVLRITGCTRPVRIAGNGARLKCAPGLRYGTYDPLGGAATARKLPFTNRDERATPYVAMIQLEKCSGPIEVRDVELDGSIDTLELGGEYGDRGRQIQATGLSLINNSGAEAVSGVYTHHHALDGIRIDGVDRATGARREFRNVRSEYNGRQGCSIVGGHGYRFTDCRFNHTGRAKIMTAPGAGVDIEAQGGKKNRDFTFVDCVFSDNAGAGMVADSGDSAGASFTGCTFIGTTNWSAWPSKPDMRFSRCSFVGSIARCFGDEKNPARATRFDDCTFRDDPALAPGRKVFLGRSARRPIADLGAHANILFNRCTFRLTHQATLPWSTKAIYNDCRMTQATDTQGVPRGIYRGRTTITGNVNLSGSRIEGSLTVNGKPRR